MANLSGFNAHEVDPTADFDPIPAGKYVAVITKTEVKPNKAGTGSYLQFIFQIFEGEYSGRLLWARLNLDNPNETAVKIARGELSAICRAAPAKECPECNSVVAAGYASCPDCGYEFPPPERNPHESEASSASVLSGEVTNTVYEVQDVTYYVHTKRGADPDAPKTMRVEYQVALDEFVSEWVCFEHTGFARRKAEAWWRRRSPDPVPATAERAVELAEAGALADTHSIIVRSVDGEPYDRVVDYRLGHLPEPLGVTDYESFGGEEDIPF